MHRFYMYYIGNILALFKFYYVGFFVLKLYN